MTLSGLRGSMVADLIENIGAKNQLEDDIVRLIMKNEPYNISPQQYIEQT